MPRYSVNLVIRDWVTVGVVAPSIEVAEEKAKERVAKAFNENRIEWICGKHEFSGFTNESLVNKVPD